MKTKWRRKLYSLFKQLTMGGKMTEIVNIEKLEKMSEIIYSNPFENIKLIKEIQLEILDIIIEIEEEIQKNKLTIDSLRSINKRKDILKDDRIKNSNKINELKKNNIQCKEHIKSIKEIIDAIVFSLFDKSDLKMLCYKQSAGFIGGKTGLKKELEIFERFFNNGYITILNDLTNCIRYGDLTIYNNGLPSLLEVKSSKNTNQRIERQKDCIKEKMEVIENDQIDNFLNSDLKFRRIYTSCKEKNYKTELIDLIREAYCNGHAYKEFEEGLHYIVEYKGMNEEELKKILQSIKNNTLYYINGMKYGKRHNFTPFRLIFNDERIRNDFFNGEIIILVIVDNDVLYNHIKNYGYEVKLNENEELEVYFDNNGYYSPITVSSFNLFRLGREFLSLEWFASTIDDVIKSILEKN